jgi:hypothetical protein
MGMEELSNERNLLDLREGSANTNHAGLLEHKRQRQPLLHTNFSI